MEEKAMKAHPELFNSPLETGVRTVVLLNSAYPRAFDLKELTWLDHLVVHTGDIDGPDSLHPNVQNRDGELLVRRTLVEDGVTLMRRVHLIEAKYGETGIVYAAMDQAASFVTLIRSEYGRALKDRAEWLIAYLAQRGEKHLHEVITQKMGRWAVEFQSDVKPAGSA
jgi:hypothetical protein